MKYAAIIALLLSSPAIASDTQKYSAAPLPLTYKSFKDTNPALIMSLTEEVDEYTIDPLIEQLKTFSEKGVKRAYLEISSPGGSVSAGLRFINAIHGARDNFGLKLTCVVDGVAASMAAIIVSYCDESYMTFGSFLMFHKASYSVGGDSEQVRSRFIFLDRYLAKIEKALAAQLGMSEADYLAMRDDEAWFDYEDSATAGFVNGIAYDYFHLDNPTKLNEKKVDREFREDRGLFDIDPRMQVKISEKEFLRIPAVLGRITPETALKTIDEILANKNQSVLPIYINSPGGDVYSLENLIMALKYSRLPSECYVGKLAQSAAAFLTAYCDKVYVQKESLLMFHHATITATLNPVQSIWVGFTLSKLYDETAAALGLKPETFELLLQFGDRSGMIPSDLAIRYGLADDYYEVVQ